METDSEMSERPDGASPARAAGPGASRGPSPGPAGRALRILHLLSGKERGGILRVVDAASSGMSAGFADISVAILDDSAIAPPAGVRIARFSRGTALGAWRAPGVLAFARRERFDVVHSHNVISNLYGWAIRRRVRGVRHVVHVHSHLGHVLAESQRSRLKRALLLWGNMRALRSCDRVIAVAESIRNYLIERRVDPRKIEVIRNAVDLARIEADSRRECSVAASLAARPPAPGGEETREPDRPWVVASIGRLSLVKNHRLLLEAARLVLRQARVKFVLVGDGPERTRLERLARETGVAGSVVFAGWMENPYPVLAAADLLAMTSNSEGLPVAPLEAMALGKPVVATRVGGVAEVVRDGISGDLVPSGDAGALAAAMLRLLADPRRRRDFGSAGREIVSREFSREAMVRRLEEVYRSLHGGPDPREAAGRAGA